MKKIFVFFLLTLFFSIVVEAQVVVKRSTEIVTIGGTEYYMHHVKRGETLYSISKAYNVSVEEISKLNPEVNDGLQADMVIGIPIVENSDEEKQPVLNEVENKIEEAQMNVDYDTYSVGRNETLYMIARRFGIDLADFKALNSGLTNEPAEGTVIKVPLIRNEKEYFIHKVELNERTSSLLSRWKVDEKTFRALNPSVGSHVFSDQTVMMPIEKAETVEIPVIPEEPVQEPVAVEEITETNPEVNEGQQSDMGNEAPKVELSDKEMQPVQNEAENKSFEPQKVNIGGGNYTVGRNETLYTIAKKFGIDLAEFKALNPGLTNKPAEGTVIKVPPIRNDEEYLVHKVEWSEKTSSLLAKWMVDEGAFRALNPAVGARVFSGQMVLIPIEKTEIIEAPIAVDEIVEEEPVVEDKPVLEPVFFEEEPAFTADCAEKSENVHGRYKVALLIPLYLNEVENILVSLESVLKSRKARPLSFLQFYEGFMIAVDSLTKHYGLNLDLTVIDVTENVGTAQNAISQLEKNPVDLIVGPFFSKSFGVVQDYAKNHKTLVVNPLSTRENIVNENPYVVKLKPNVAGQLSQLASMVNQFYGDSNVSIICQSSISENSSAYLDEMERLLNLAVNSEVVLKTDDFLRFAQDESRRKEMGSNLPSTIEVEGQIYATKDLKDGALDDVRIENSVGRYVYGSDGLDAFNKSLSEVRNNLVIAYGKDNVFATQILNKLNKTAETHPVTLVAMPDWSGLDKLLVDNLLKMNAIYFSEDFVDYNSNEAKRFVCQFRKMYVCEPTDYAFLGFDVAWYFMNAFMRFGHDPKDCLLDFEMPLLSNSYSFVKNASVNGLENYHWSIYQFEKERVELKPVDLSNVDK